MTNIYSILKSTGLDCVYSHFEENHALPYIAYIGAGQDTAAADDTYYWKENSYQIEYYFKDKNEANEEAIEQALTDAGFLYQKSEDTYIEDQGVFVIYYTI